VNEVNLEQPAISFFLLKKRRENRPCQSWWGVFMTGIWKDLEKVNGSERGLIYKPLPACLPPLYVYIAFLLFYCAQTPVCLWQTGG